MIDSKQTKIINTLWSSLEERLNNVCMTRYGSKLLRISKEESKNHVNNPRGISATMEAKFFATWWIHQYFTGKSPLPEVKDFLVMRESCFLAAALVLEYPEIIRQWTEAHADELSVFATYDYVQLNAA